MIIRNGKEIADIRIRNKPIVKVMFGRRQVWPDEAPGPGPEPTPCTALWDDSKLWDDTALWVE